jgi:hypothetical protein
MKWENLSKLLKIVEESLVGHGYFMANLEVGLDNLQGLNDQTVKVTQRQTGVMRTNCMDCLDRTNVV